MNLGRSKSFWIYFYPELQKRFPQFKDVTLEEFYKGVNKVQPSLIRIEADELIGYFPSYALGNVYGAQFLNEKYSHIYELNK